MTRSRQHLSVLWATLVLCAASLSTARPAAADTASFDPTHARFTVLLNRHVTWNAAGTATTVDYSALARDRATLDTYTGSLSAVTIDEFNAWTQAQRVSFLINAYNAFTLQRILSRYPNLESIRDFGNIVFDSPWKQRFFLLLGARRHLDEVEHELLRGAADFDEPRIHFAVNCASIGCPALRPEAYRADRLSAQLEDQTRRFLRDRARNRFDPDGRGTAWISPIFKWYAEDFEAGHRGHVSVQHFLQTYGLELTGSTQDRELLQRGAFALKYSDYSWKLNDRDR